MLIVKRLKTKVFTSLAHWIFFIVAISATFSYASNNKKNTAKNQLAHKWIWQFHYMLNVCHDKYVRIKKKKKNRNRRRIKKIENIGHAFRLLHFARARTRFSFFLFIFSASILMEMMWWSNYNTATAAITREYIIDRKSSGMELRKTHAWLKTHTVCMNLS